MRIRLIKTWTHLCSVPNVRFFVNLYELLLKRDWKYRESGILDNTHLRFFTEKSLKGVFMENEYRIEIFKGINPYKINLKSVRSIATGVLWVCLLLFTFFTYRDTRYFQFGFRIQVIK